MATKRAEFVSKERFMTVYSQAVKQGWDNNQCAKELGMVDDEGNATPSFVSRASAFRREMNEQLEASGSEVRVPLLKNARGGRTAKEIPVSQIESLFAAADELEPEAD